MSRLNIMKSTKNGSKNLTNNSYCKAKMGRFVWLIVHYKQSIVHKLLL